MSLTAVALARGNILLTCGLQKIMIMTVIMIVIMTDLRGLSPWLRARRVKRRAEIASLMVIVTGTVSQNQDSLDELEQS